MVNALAHRMIQGRLGGPGDYAALRVKLQALQAACVLECAQLDKTPAGLHGKPLPPSRQGSYIATERCSQATDNVQVQMQIALLPCHLGCMQRLHSSLVFATTLSIAALVPSKGQSCLALPCCTKVLNCLKLLHLVSRIRAHIFILLGQACMKPGLQGCSWDCNSHES